MYQVTTTVSVEQIVSFIFGRKPQFSLPILDKGIGSEVYDVSVRNRRFIIKMDSSEGAWWGYRKEQWCIERAWEVGVPGPKVVAIGQLSSTAFLVLEKIHGDDGSDYRGDRVAMWRKLGEYARRINSIPVSGCGFMMTNPEKGQFESTWREYISGSLDDLFGDGFFVEEGLFSAETNHSTSADLRTLLELDFAPTLCHANLAPNNTIMGDDGEVYVIDWGSAMGHSAPEQDIAEVLAWGYGEECEQAFLEGYGVDSAEFHHMLPTIDRLTTLKYLESIRWAADNHENWRELPFVQHALNNLQQTTPTFA